jgi:c-di-AMP phosphodiesterase-like protein
MTSFFRKRAIRYSLAVLSILGVMAAVLLLISQFWPGLLFSVIFMVAMGFAWKIEEKTYIETEKHIETLSYRMKNVGEEALLELPIGIILINEKNIVEWANPYAVKVFAHQETLIGDDLFDLSGQFLAILNS